MTPTRDLYATKDTYISLALTAGVNLTWLSEQTRVDERTLRRHCGTYVHTEESDRAQVSKIDPSDPSMERGSARPDSAAPSSPATDAVHDSGCRGLDVSAARRDSLTAAEGDAAGEDSMELTKGEFAPPRPAQGRKIHGIAR